MSSDHSDIWAGIGGLLSSIAGVFAYLYSIGLVPVFMFIAGACFTLWTQERLEKKRRKRDFDIKMTNLVYGPFHQRLNSIRLGLREFLSPSGLTLNEIVEDFRFNLVKEELRNRIKEFEEKLLPYVNLLREASNQTDILVIRNLKEHEIEKAVSFVLWAGHQEIFRTTMTDIIFRDKAPLDFLTEKAKGYQNTSMIVYVGQKSEGLFSSEHRIHQISTEILTKVREDSLVQEQRTEREYLLKECNSLIESIEKEIVL